MSPHQIKTGILNRLLNWVFLFVILLGSGTPGTAQSSSDSLWNVWKDESQADSNRVKALHKVVRKDYLFSQPDSAFYLSQVEYDFAKSKGLQLYMSEALNHQGLAHYFQGNYTVAVDYFTQSLDIKNEIGDKKGMAGLLSNMGMIYMKQGEYTKALDYYSRSLSTRREVKDEKGISESYNNMGVVFKKQGDYANAIDYYTRSLRIKEKANDKKGMASSLNNIGTIFKLQQNFSKALEYYNRSLVIKEEINDKNGMSASLTNIGLVFLEKGDHIYNNGKPDLAFLKYDTAMNYFSRSLVIEKEVGSKGGMAGTLSNIGMVYMKQGLAARNVGNDTKAIKKYNRAIEYHQRCLTICEEIGNKYGLAVSLNNIGIIHQKKGEPLKAITYNTRALSIAKEIGSSVEIKKAAGALYKSYKSTGKIKSALEMYELHISYKDSIQSEENQKAVIRQEFKYEYEKKAYADSIKQAEEDKLTQATIKAQNAQIKQEKTQRYALYGGVGVLLLFGGFMFNRFRVTKRQKNLIQKQKAEVELQKNEAEHQKNLVQEKNTEILDSINYAKRLQEAILPPQKLVKQWLTNSFILYKPKDIVAGDFYWMETVEDTVFFAAADCTGHGVPGAMVSVVCSNALSKAVIEEGISDPGKILDRTRELVIERFGRSEENIQDGMDIALCSLHTQTQTLHYSGAHNPLWIIRKEGKEVEEIKADKQPIGRYTTSDPFTTHEIQLNEGDSIYIFSDGFPDQFGGEKGKKYKSGNFKKFLLSIQEKDMDEQRELIGKEFESWKGKLEQLDDVCVIGFRC